MPSPFSLDSERSIRQVRKRDHELGRTTGVCPCRHASVGLKDEGRSEDRRKGWELNPLPVVAQRDWM